MYVLRVINGSFNNLLPDPQSVWVLERFLPTRKETNSGNDVGNFTINFLLKQLIKNIFSICICISITRFLFVVLSFLVNMKIRIKYKKFKIQQKKQAKIRIMYIMLSVSFQHKKTIFQAGKETRKRNYGKLKRAAANV